MSSSRSGGKKRTRSAQRSFQVIDEDQRAIRRTGREAIRSDSLERGQAQGGARANRENGKFYPPDGT